MTQKIWWTPSVVSILFIFISLSKSNNIYYLKLFAIARQEPFYVWFHTDADELTNAAGGDEKDNELVGFPPGGKIFVFVKSTNSNGNSH